MNKMKKFNNNNKIINKKQILLNKKKNFSNLIKMRKNKQNQ